MEKKLLSYLFFALTFLLAGCGDVQVYDVDTKFSNVIQVEPVSKTFKTVFLRIKDVTGYASELASEIEAQLKREGYTLVDDPEAAKFKLMVNVMKFGQGTSEDQLTFMQAINPLKAAELSVEKNKIRTVRRNVNVYQKDKPGYFNVPYGKQKNEVYAEDELTEESTIKAFADRVGIAEVEIVLPKGNHLKTRLMVGVNLRGGIFASPTPVIDRLGWTRLIHKLAVAIVSMF